MALPPDDLFHPVAAPAPADHWRLLGADCSYYTAKISACLRYKRVPHTSELATRETFTREILPRVGWPVIPVLIAPDGSTLQDTSEMFDAVEVAVPSPATLPADGVGRFLCYLLEMICDEWVKVPALHYRWNHDNDFAVAEFGRNNGPAQPLSRQLVTGEKIALRFRGWLGALGVNPHSVPAIEAEYHALLALLESHFAMHDFLLGTAPTLADFALYGPLHAHLFRDPNSGKVMRERAPGVVDWVCRMGTPPAPVALPAETRVPATLLPVLRLWCRDYVPVLLAQYEALARWLVAHDATGIPRELGQHAVTLGRGTPHEAVTTRSIFSYDHWMLQRALAVHAHAGAAGAREIMALAQSIGAAPLLALPAQPVLARKDYQLVRANRAA